MCTVVSNAMEFRVCVWNRRGFWRLTVPAVVCRGRVCSCTKRISYCDNRTWQDLPPELQAGPNVLQALNAFVAVSQSRPGTANRAVFPPLML
jgi:hypothetical protein